jgi:hypothetical protein
LRRRERLHHFFFFELPLFFGCLLGYKNTLGISQTQQQGFKGQNTKIHILK